MTGDTKLPVFRTLLPSSLLGKTRGKKPSGRKYLWKTQIKIRGVGGIVLSVFCEQSLSGYVGEETAPVEERVRQREWS